MSATSHPEAQRGVDERSEFGGDLGGEDLFAGGVGPGERGPTPVFQDPGQVPLPPDTIPQRAGTAFPAAPNDYSGYDRRPVYSRSAGRSGADGSPFVRGAGGGVAKGVGRGPIAPDPRKFRYDVTLARSRPAVNFGASKIDRMDAYDAGEFLDQIHKMFGIDREPEEFLLAFDKALWFEHTVNGASMLQTGGTLTAGTTKFDVNPILALLGENARRFFRAYADTIAEIIRNILDEYDAYDHESVDKVGQIRQVAAERGLQKFPHLAHDSSSACVRITAEERNAIMASKFIIIPSVVNKVDALPPRVGEARGESTPGGRA